MRVTTALAKSGFSQYEQRFSNAGKEEGKWCGARDWTWQMQVVEAARWRLSLADHQHELI
jgi:hypothetical protein